MKTTELVKLIEELGLDADFDYVLDDDGDEDEVLSAYYDGQPVLSVYLNWLGVWVMYESAFDELDPYKRHKLLDAFIEYTYTPFDEREEEKRYIFPPPGLITTDGEQQYLTQVGRHWFVCRRKKDLRQTWKEEHIKWVPELYRDFKVEVDK